MLSFLEFIEEKNAVFEKKAGLSNGFVNNIGDNVRKNTIKKIKTAYPQFNTDWWETGVGNMINETNNSEIGSHSINQYEIVQDHSINQYEIAQGHSIEPV